MCRIILFLQIFIAKCVFSFPVSSYKISYLPLCNLSNYPFMTTYPVSITPISYYNNFYSNGILPIMVYDEVTYYGRRKYHIGRAYTYSRSIPVYSSSYTPYLIVQPKLSNVSRLPSAVFTSSSLSTSPSLTLSTKLVALSTPSNNIPIKLARNGTYKINIKKQPTVDHNNRPNSVDKNKSTTDSEIRSNADEKSRDINQDKVTVAPTTMAADNVASKPNTEKEHNDLTESTTNENNDPNKLSLETENNPEESSTASKNTAVSESSIITVSESNTVSGGNDVFVSTASKYNTASKSTAGTHLNTGNVSNSDSKSYTEIESNVITESNASDTSDSEPIKEKLEQISGKVAFKGLIPASGRVKIFAKFS